MHDGHTDCVYIANQEVLGEIARYSKPSIKSFANIIVRVSISYTK